MSKLRLLVTVLFASAHTSWGQDQNFATEASDIADKLAQPSFVDPSSTQPKTRSIMGPGAATIKTRAITVLAREGGLDEIQIIQVPVQRIGGAVNLKVEFDRNSSDLRPVSTGLLDELALALLDERLSDRTITINGHTDSDGTENFNLRLSLNRADTVKSYLVQNHSISQGRLSIIGFGEILPLVPNDSDDNKQVNRRVEVVAE